MLYTAEDTITRATTRLRKVLDNGSKEAREIVEKLNSKILDNMEITLPALIETISLLFKCESLYSNEKYTVLDLFYDLISDLLRNKESIDLMDIPVSLGKMKFLKNEKNVERAVIVYLKVITLLLKVADTVDLRITIFKVFCTLFMSKSFISSTKCGYLIPPMFKEFLIEYPEFINNLLENQDKLIFCPPLLEIVLVSCQKMNSTLSRLIVLDSIKRNCNKMVIMLQGKGFYDPFYFQLYMERETNPMQEIFPIFCKKSFLEYMFLDVSTRLTSKSIGDIVIEKICEAGTIHFTRLLKEPDTQAASNAGSCAYCPISCNLDKIEETRKTVQAALDQFNISGDAGPLIELMDKLGYKDSYIAAARILRVNTDTNLVLLGKYLGREEHARFLEAFCYSFDFSEYDILTALRVFLLSFNLPGEGQKIERIICAFCKKYSEDGKQDSDTVLSIAMSIIVLNTSIHNVNAIKKITVEEFTQIIMKECKDVDLEYLESLYAQVKQRKLQVPVSNSISLEVIEFLEQMAEADQKLHSVLPVGQRYSYCSSCTKAVYSYIIQKYKMSKSVMAHGTSSEIKTYIRSIVKIGISETIVKDAIEMISDPYLIVKLVDDYKDQIYSLWPAFIEALEKIYLQRDDTGTTPRFFRNIFAFGKEPKKDKKDLFPDSVIFSIIEKTKNISDNELLEISNILQTKMESSKTKALYKTAYILVKNNANRIAVVGSLLEMLMSTGGASGQDILAICETAPFSDILHLLSEFQYKPSKHVTSSVISVLQYIIVVLTNKSLSSREMHAIKEWTNVLIGSESFKLRNSEVVISIWETIEEISLRLDSLGYDSFEIFIKMKDILTKKSRSEILSNTSAYYKNINRMLLCLDILSFSNSPELTEIFSKMISGLLDKDTAGCLSILESCEHVLETIPEIQEKVEEIVYEKTQGIKQPDIKYLKKLIMKMNLKMTPKKEIVDL
ncbi:hypothetical protein NEMIN01_2338 [Nematocida minor]|uniref:uncharacterized protein n=1 Tax=Nematocida minor TaxID=1912983 RepID=UPI00221FA7E7|nr:uncharacterized protein NEMIN01_2338 [Nematocida minor]KAI5192994.1 hypothetical protein NEMIN01_2338 [Nematocida minor]